MRIQLLVAWACVALLASCGGGGSSDSSASTSTPPASTPATVQGLKTPPQVPLADAK